MREHPYSECNWAADCDPVPTPGFAAIVALAALVLGIFGAGAVIGWLVAA